MKIGIDAHAAEKDGTGNCTYIRNLLLELKEIDKENEYIFYVTDINHPFYKNFSQNEKLKIKQLPIKTPFLRIPIFLAKETFKDSLDILHVQYISPPFFKGKLVVTIHDLCFLHFPESFSKFEVFRSKILIPFTAKKADKVITGSNFSKNDIISNYKINSQKIEVIPYGVSSNFKPIKNEEKIKNVLKKYNISGEYILTVGRLNPRKNLLSLVKAYNILKKNKKIPHKLVIAGKEDYNSKETIKFVKKMDCYKNIIFTGFVRDEDLPYLYNGADIFVYPSLFEGVGLPVLEAMSCGIPVITSNTTALKEIIGNAGIAINPFNIDEIAQAIFQIISDRNLKSDYIKKAFIRAKEFSWKLTAQKTLKIYKELLRYY